MLLSHRPPPPLPPLLIISLSPIPCLRLIPSLLFIHYAEERKDSTASSWRLRKATDYNLLPINLLVPQSMLYKLATEQISNRQGNSVNLYDPWAYIQEGIVGRVFCTKRLRLRIGVGLLLGREGRRRVVGATYSRNFIIHSIMKYASFCEREEPK